jgi:hypothetical protein
MIHPVSFGLPNVFDSITLLLIHMSCALTLFNSHLPSDKRSKSHNRNPSTHREVLSYPARLVTLIRSMNMEPRSWVVELTEKLENLGVREDQGGDRRSDGDDQNWSDARPTSRHGLRKNSRSVPSKRHDDRGRPSRDSPPIESPYRQEPSRSPPERSLDRRFTRRHDSVDRSGIPSRQRHQTPWPSSPRRDSSGLNDSDISPEHGALPEHSLRREKGRSVTKPGLSRQFSGPGLEPITPAPSSRYLDASYTQSSRSRGTHPPVTTYHQEFRPELPSTPSSGSRVPNTERRESKATQTAGRSFTNHSTESSRLRRTPSQPRRRTSTELVMEYDPWINPDSREVYRPYFMSRDQAESSELRSCFRRRQARPDSKDLKVKIIESQKTYTVIDPRLPRKKPKRTEVSTSRVGHEEHFTDLAYEFWEEDVVRARGEAGYARSRAEFLHDYAQRNWAERLLLKIL